MDFKIPFRRLVVDLTCYLYVLLFVYAAVSKLLDFENFRVQIAQSPLLSAFAYFVAWAVPMFELLIVLLLVLPKYRLAGLYSAFMLMVSFTAYIYTILNYSDFVPCSCGGILEKMGWQEHLIFNLVFVLLAVTAIVLEWKKNSHLQRLRSPVLQLPLLTLFGVGTVMVLFIWSENITHYHNTFIRRFPRTPAVKVQQADLGYDSYYMAGIEHTKVYLGNSEAQLYVLEFDSSLQSRLRHRISLDRTELPFNAVKVKTDASHFFVTDGSIPCVFRGKIDGWKAKLVKQGGIHFSLTQPLDSSALGVRFQQSGNGESVLGLVSMLPAAGDVTNPALLQKQSDGLFDTDGYLLRSKSLDRLVYLYAYRNSFVVYDRKLRKEYTGRTIDTISQQSFDVVTIKSNGQTKMGRQPLIVNRNAAVSGNLLFVHSGVPGRYERERMWKRNSIIDVYDLSSNSYLLSFPLPYSGKDHIREFAVSGDRLYVLSGTSLTAYKLIPTITKHYQL